MTDWLKAAPWIICGVLALMVAGISHAYLGERDDFRDYKRDVEALGKKAAEEKIRIEKVYADNFEKVKKKYEKDIPRIRSNAVAAYKLRFPDAGSCPVPGTAPSIKMDDGAGEKLVVTGAFVKDCADDAAKLGAWQEQCRLNNCTVK